MSTQKTLTFIQKANLKHDNKYDYSMVNYTNNKNKVTINCKIHKEFKQQPTHHLNGNGCSKYMQGSGCTKCSGTYNYSTQEYIDKCIEKHGNRYDYSQTHYNNTKDKVVIICKEHGKFEQQASEHIKGSGCSSCVNKSEGKLLEWLSTYAFDKFNDTGVVKSQMTFADLISSKGGLYRFDACIGNIIIELDGDQHFKQISNWKPYMETVKNDIIKTKYLLDNGYHLIRIYQPWVWNDRNNWRNLLKDSINFLYNEEDPQIIYIGEDSLYDTHKRMLSGEILL